jgi:NADH-quinone oxidoreductase subunit A
MLGLGWYALAICAMVGVMLGASYALGPRRRGPADNNPFESGILPAHDTHIRFPSQFYLVAMFFVIFDLEMVFVFAWAVAVKAAGWAGYGGMLAFLALLLVALAYLWRAGGLEWGPAGR